MIRRNYRMTLNTKLNNIEDYLASAFIADAARVRMQIDSGKIYHVAMYRHEDMLFMYIELADDSFSPEEVFCELSALLVEWPERDGLKKFVPMFEIYYHAIPQDISSWFENRKAEKNRRGRIAILKPDKMWSYITYHDALVKEGLIPGDMYQYIALHEDILFSYFEEPKHMVNLKNINVESEVLKKWMEVDPESHFDHTLSGEANFLLLPLIFTDSMNA